MKILGMIGFALGTIAAGLGLYNHFTNAADAAELEGATGEAGRWAWLDAHDAMMMYGEISLLVGGVALILCVIAALKTKNGMAWAGAGLSLVGVFFGLLHATHMFS